MRVFSPNHRKVSWKINVTGLFFFFILFYNKVLKSILLRNSLSFDDTRRSVSGSHPHPPPRLPGKLLQHRRRGGLRDKKTLFIKSAVTSGSLPSSTSIHLLVPAVALFFFFFFFDTSSRIVGWPHTTSSLWGSLPAKVRWKKLGLIK